MLRDMEACKRCICAKCGSGLGKGLCYICRHNQNSLNDSPSISETSSQSPLNINHCCYECGDPLDGFFCKRCTCKSCGKDAHIGYNCPSKVPVISNQEPCNNQTIDELPQALPIFHLTFHSKAESPFTMDLTFTYVDESPNVFNPPLQSSVYPCEFCGNDAYYGHYCTPQAPLPVCHDDDDDEERSNSLDDNIISGLPSFSAITPDEPVLSTEEPDNSLSMGDEHLDTIPTTESDEFIKSDDQFDDLSEFNEEFSSSDDDSLSFDKIDYVEASPPDSELVSSEVMEIVIPEGDMLLFEAFLNDDHSSDFQTKSSSTSLNSLLEETNYVDNSLPEFTTFSKVLFDAECESNSSDDQSCSNEDILKKIVLKPLSEEEIIPMKSLRTHDSSLPISSKIDSFLDEFADELTLLKSILSGIDETDCDFEEDIRLIEKLLYDNSSPRPPEEFVSANFDAKIKSFSPSPILVKDSDSLMEEIDLFCTPDYPMPLGIMDKDYDSERDSHS
nr:hypothetical protein [Tanacetum cinerariifolium]